MSKNETNPESQSQENSMEQTTKRVKRSEKVVKNYQFFILRAVLFLLVLWVLLFKIVGLTHVPNGDMYPRLDAGDLVLYYRLDKDVRAQDVIVIEKVTPDSGEEKYLFVGRVVAAQGDTVEISDTERLLVNGNTLMENNIFYSTPRYEGYTEYPLTLGPGECFVLGDSRHGATDSRYFGPVSQDEIVGTVITVVRRNNL